MITNLFSVFDPSSSLLSIAWISLILLPLTITNTSWKPTVALNAINTNITNTLHNEVSFTLNKTNNSQEIIILLVFMSILVINFTALYPQVFSPTSHLIITLPLSLVTWLAIVSFGWTNNTSHILIHLVPQGTPNVLMSFMVLIELVSNLIRPITLCVRLTANLIAGHLLITLLGNALMTTSIPITILSIVAPITLTVLESAVACIQAYVFMTLITLYITEAN